MEKLSMETKNLAEEKFEALKKLFPNALTETKDAQGRVVRAIDKDVLMQEIATEVVEGRDERYQFTWPDKRKAILAANAPTSKTLRPSRDESVNFDQTENLYIEGDNLEVLKLLQETYLGKVKMIYIDPPYNTGSDFVYNDDFKQSMEDYIEDSGQYDEEGNRLEKNLESNGRFHTDWLNMIYPRLKLARNLLSEDGVIFISIDDNEQANLKKLCDEVFGESSFITKVIWRKKTGSSDVKGIATITEYALVYVKNKKETNNALDINYNSYDRSRYKLVDEYVENRGNYYIDNLDRGSLGYVESLDFGIKAPDGKIVYPNGRIKKFNDGWRWTWGKEKVEWGLKNGFLVFKKSDSTDAKWRVYRKNYLKVNNEGKPVKKGAPYKNLITDVINTEATLKLNKLIGDRIFSYSKPTTLIKDYIKFVQSQDSIILDFFSGSATTAHAVMELNAEDGGHRKYIMVQLPEETDEKSEAYKAGYKNICEIGKERIRRAGQKILEDKKDQEGIEDLDIGFRVLKADSSNMKDVYYTPSSTDQSFLESLEENIKEDRSPEDLLFQVMLDLGIPLSSKISIERLEGKDVYLVEDGFLMACFDGDLGEEVVQAIAQRKPYYAVFRDASMGSDSLASNFDQIFATTSPETVRRVL